MPSKKLPPKPPGKSDDDEGGGFPNPVQAIADWIDGLIFDGPEEESPEASEVASNEDEGESDGGGGDGEPKVRASSADGQNLTINLNRVFKPAKKRSKSSAGGGSEGGTPGGKSE